MNTGYFCLFNAVGWKRYGIKQYKVFSINIIAYSRFCFKPMRIEWSAIPDLT
jgi:hypothetical protein